MQKCPRVKLLADTHLKDQQYVKTRLQFEGSVLSKIKRKPFAVYVDVIEVTIFQLFLAADISALAWTF